MNKDGYWKVQEVLKRVNAEVAIPEPEDGEDVLDVAISIAGIGTIKVLRCLQEAGMRYYSSCNTTPGEPAFDPVAIAMDKANDGSIVQTNILLIDRSVLRPETPRTDS